MTNETVKTEWRAEFERCTSVPDICDNCGEYVPEYRAGSGFLCDLCADAAIEYGRQHVPEAYEE